jgi:HEAT repeat protein
MEHRRTEQHTQLCLDFRAQEPEGPETPPGRSQLERLLLHSYLNDLESSSWRARKKGAKGLGQLGPVAGAAVPQLEKLLDDPEEEVRKAAGDALSRVTTQGRP